MVQLLSDYQACKATVKGGALVLDFVGVEDWWLLMSAMRQYLSQRKALPSGKTLSSDAIWAGMHSDSDQMMHHEIRIYATPSSTSTKGNGVLGARVRQPLSDHEMAMVIKEFAGVGILKQDTCDELVRSVAKPGFRLSR